MILLTMERKMRNTALLVVWLVLRPAVGVLRHSRGTKARSGHDSGNGEVDGHRHERESAGDKTLTLGIQRTARTSLVVTMGGHATNVAKGHTFGAELQRNPVKADESLLDKAHFRARESDGLGRELRSAAQHRRPRPRRNMLLPKRKTVDAQNNAVVLSGIFTRRKSPYLYESPSLPSVSSFNNQGSLIVDAGDVRTAVQTGKPGASITQPMLRPSRTPTRMPTPRPEMSITIQSELGRQQPPPPPPQLPVQLPFQGVTSRGQTSQWNPFNPYTTNAAYNPYYVLNPYSPYYPPPGKGIGGIGKGGKGKGGNIFYPSGKKGSKGKGGSTGKKGSKHTIGKGGYPYGKGKGKGKGKGGFIINPYWYHYIPIHPPPIHPPTQMPTPRPTQSPTITMRPTDSPTFRPTGRPTTRAPTQSPTFSPTKIPTSSPTSAPTAIPTIAPTFSPSIPPTGLPTPIPTGLPTAFNTQPPTARPTGMPSPSGINTFAPTPLTTPVPSPQGATSAPTTTPRPSPVGADTVAPTPGSVSTSAPTPVGSQSPPVPTIAPSLQGTNTAGPSAPLS